jgi:hypothetical protein
MDMRLTTDLEVGSQTFWKHGFVTLRQAFSREEMCFVREAVVRNKEMTTVADQARAMSVNGHPQFLMQTPLIESVCAADAIRTPNFY